MDTVEFIINYGFSTKINFEKLIHVDNEQLEGMEISNNLDIGGYSAYEVIREH